MGLNFTLQALEYQILNLPVLEKAVNPVTVYSTLSSLMNWEMNLSRKNSVIRATF